MTIKPILGENTFLFEVSWEVCNKVGGIYTVIRSKLKEAIKNFGSNYILIGPWLEHNRHFTEASNPFLDNIAQILHKKNISCTVGYWDTEGTPAVILVGYQGRYKIDDLLYRLWSSFGIDSLASNFEYIEPLLFATVSGEVIQTITEQVIPKDIKVIAHFHEWLSGAGLLYLKQYATNVATVFTTHATMLGRSLASNHINIYNLPSSFSPRNEATKQGVFAKYSMEAAAASNADCFTTVSLPTAEESLVILNKYPDKIVLNGLAIEKIQHGEPVNSRMCCEDIRKKLLSIAQRITNKQIPENSHLWITSGRYEFHNKGFDVLLKSLSQLDKKLTDNSPSIVVFFLIAAQNKTSKDSMLLENIELTPEQKVTLGLTTHRIDNVAFDPIAKLCTELGFNKNSKKITIIYTDAYLNGNDGVYDLHYESILSACDLSIFPSFYEPWGYTPLESIAYGVPTITTDLAGFGCWVKSLKEDYRDAIYVLEYRGKEENAVVDTLSDHLGVVTHQDNNKWTEFKNKAKLIAKLADWKLFYKDYIDAYAQAIEFNEIYYAKFGLVEKEESYVTSFHEEASGTPRFRIFRYQTQLPEKLKDLRELAYNLWWSWNDHNITQVFREIDPNIWNQVNQNPVSFLHLVSSSALMKKTYETNYMKKYNNAVNSFQNYIKDNPEHEFCDYNLINKQHPIAYFCLEYGLDGSLPIYSGGLGILAGDYLKTMSDMNIPFIAIGLFYQQGYFTQKIDSHGEQVVDYVIYNPNQMPMRQLNTTTGEPLLINIEILDRTIYVAVWEIKVGKISLYLLDTDVPKNSPEDRQITNRLYGGSREYRILQEFVLGIGGTRFIVEELKITPSLYHLNEGHSAFLLLERLKNLFNQGLSPDEAYEIVRASSVFTTHTSVPAGNEVFAEDMIIKYFAKPTKLLGLQMDGLINLGKATDGISKTFSMTALALRFTIGINAVSKIHEKVAKSMWKNIWPGFLENELPIQSVTNGIHLPTWLGPEMNLLYDNYLGADWIKSQHDAALWENVYSIPDKALWEAHQTQKERLIEEIKKRIIKEYTFRNEDESLINDTLKVLDTNTIFMGLARRFATYKRHDLILRNKERLANILTDEDRPMVLIVAGKAHPADGLGQKNVALVMRLARQKNFKGHIIFLENYDINLAKMFVQGVDVWLNTPIINTEACGTSGMKLSANGGLNFSIKDGWWAEAYQEDPRIGWAIENSEVDDPHRRDDMENIFLLNTLEHEIIRTYYENKNQFSYNPEWISRMKTAIAKVSYRFNTQRMVKDYFEQLYCPIANYSHQLLKDNFKNLKNIVEWKHDVILKFNTVKIKTILVNGIKDGKIKSDGIIQVKVLLFSGKMTAKELNAQLILAKSDGSHIISDPIIVPLKLADSRESGILTYTIDYHVEDTGFYAYGIRVLPWHPLLFQQQDIGVALWG